MSGRAVIAAVFIAVLIIAFLTGIGGCAAVPKKPAEVVSAISVPVAGIVLTICGSPVALELITDDGHVYFNRKALVTADVWGAGLLEIESLGANGVRVELVPDCVLAKG